MRDASGDFRAFAQGFGPVLYRVGYLLAGDAKVARDLVDASLGRTWRRWRDVESGEVPELVALQALVRRFVRSRRTTGPAPRELAPARAPTDDDADAVRRDELWTAFAELTRAERAVLVLEQSSDTADVVPFGPRRQAAAAASARERLTRLGCEPTGDLLGAVLAERAARLTPIALDVDAIVKRQRTRNSAWVVASVVALALVGAAIAFGLGRDSGSGDNAGVSTPTATPTSAASARQNIEPPLPWPTRGNLADDTAVVNELRVTFAATHRNVIGGIQVVYAGDVPSGRLALVGGRSEFGPDFEWYYGPAGAPVSELLSWSDPGTWADGLGPASFASIVLNVPGMSPLLVMLGEPDLPSAEVSWRPSYPPDGSVHRAFEPLPLEDGAAVMTLGETPGNLVRVRIANSAGPSFTTQPRPVGNFRSFDDQWPAGDTRLTAELGTADSELVRYALTSLRRELELVNADDITPRVVWGGLLNGEATAVIRATLRGGGDFQLIAGWSGLLASSVVPRGAPDLPAVWLTWTEDGSEVLRIFAGSDVAQLELRSGTRVMTSAAAAPMAIGQLAVPPIEGWGELELVLIDQAGQVSWHRPLIELQSFSIVDP